MENCAGFAVIPQNYTGHDSAQLRWEKHSICVQVFVQGLMEAHTMLGNSDGF